MVVPGTHYLFGGGKSGMVYVLDTSNMGRTDTEHFWNMAKVQSVPLDAISAEWPDDPHADRAVQKFQAAINQYVPAGSPYLPHAGGHVATMMQTSEQEDAIAVGRDGSLWVYWEKDGAWTDGTSGRPSPAPMTLPHFAPTGAALTVAKQSADQWDAFLVGNDGAVAMTWVQGTGQWSDGRPGAAAGPVHVTPANFAPPGAFLAAAPQAADQLDLFATGNDGAVYVTWVGGLGHWSDGSSGNPAPARITPQHFAPPGAGVAAAHQSPDQLDAFVVGNDGRSA